MAEAQDSSTIVGNTNFSARRAFAENFGISGLVAKGEVMLRQGRLEAGNTEGFVGALESGLKFLGVEAGFGQVGREASAFNKHVRSLDNEKDAVTAIVARELLGKTMEQQADFLSAGMTNVKKVTLGLMEIHNQLPEVNGKVIGDALRKMGQEFTAAASEDVEATNEFFEGMQKARKHALTVMGKLWDAKEALDEAHKLRELVDIGRDVDRQDQYEFTMESGVARQIYSIAKRFVPAIGKRTPRLAQRAGKIANNEADQLMLSLRDKTLRMGGPLEDLQMWKLGIVNRQELGNVDVADLKSRGAKLTESEEDALLNNKDLPQFMKQVKGATVGTLEFHYANQDVQCQYYETFYGGQRKQVIKDGSPVFGIDGFAVTERVGGLVGALEEDFKAAREAYLQFDVRNAQNWSDGGIVLKVYSQVKDAGHKHDVDLDVVAEAVTIPVPQFVKKWGTYFASIGAEGVITGAKVPGRAMDFLFDSMESGLAGDALNRLKDVMVARETAMEAMQKAILEGDKKLTRESALAVRGAEFAMYRADAYAARVYDTVQMTYQKSTLPGMVGAVGEIARSAAERVTGGIGWGDNVEKVVADLDGRAALLNGRNVTEKYRGDAHSGENAGRALVDSMAEEMRIPEQYRQQADLQEYLSGPWYMRASEWLRRQVGEEGEFFFVGKLLNFKDSEFWRVIAGGSKRRSVEEVAQEYGTSYSESVQVASLLTEKVRSGDSVGDVKVEAATAILLQDAKEKLVRSTLGQILTRSNLDAMWAKVFAFGPYATAAAALGVVISHGGPVADQWAAKAHVYAGEATENLNAMQQAYDKVMEIAKSQGMHMTQSGAGADIMWKQFLNSVGHVNETIAQFTSDNYLKIKLASLIAAFSAPIAAVAPGMVSLAPHRMKMITPFMGETGEVK